MPAAAQWEDRRRFVQLSGDVDMVVASGKARAESGARAELELVAAAGERVAICRVTVSGGPEDGPFESDSLNVIETDESGAAVHVVSMEGDQMRDALGEAWERWSAMNPEIAETLALTARAMDLVNAAQLDRVELRAIYAEDLIVEDRRHAGMGRLEGVDTYADSLEALGDLTDSSTVVLGAFWGAIGCNGGVCTVRRSGEVAGGGNYESDYLAVVLHVRGRVSRVEFFEIEQLDEALARFEGLGNDNRPD
jgi:hypothetical protein